MMRTSKLYSSKGHLPPQILHYKTSADIKSPHSSPDPCAAGLLRFYAATLSALLPTFGVFSRYAKAFGDRTGRCIRDQASSCKGDDSAHCQRFKGMKIEDQSAHDESCQGHCDRLVWDEKSYREVSGARAVTLNASADDRHVAYCQASAKTLAISHVWSHGQGGRPEEVSGFNRCLHRRYVSIARTLGCDSYWMDTPCIPEDHQLRREAIMNINQVFDNSRATIICDRDLMSIDTSNLTIGVWELIVVTILVCD